MRSLLSAAVLSLFAAPTFAQAPAPATPLTPAAPVATQDPAPKKLDETTWDHFGTGITEGKNTPVADVMKDPQSFTGKTIRVEGTAGEICQVKGCWMYLGDPKSPLMVKFKDYAFFMPKDGTGRTAVLEGTMSFTQETVEQTKHYLEDAGKHEEAAKVTEGRKIYKFMASGVALQKVMKKLDETTWDHFGTGITEGKNTPVADVMKDPQSFTGKTIRVEGTAGEICQVKGCWMYLGDPKSPLMVKFKDYAFFMPKDGTGRTAVLEGTMSFTQETVEQTKHYLEDAGKHEEAAKVTEGRKIYKFMASGVALKKVAKKEG